MKAIVVGYDGSDSAKRALARAAEWATNGTTLAVVSAVHATPMAGRGASPFDPIEEDDMKRNLGEARTLVPGKELRLVKGHGDPADVIVQEAKELDADLIVVGTTGHNPVARALLGSVSTSVVHHAPCDVLVVR
jgi:nucleotide-binding universal stress UspA family protein